MNDNDPVTEAIVKEAIRNIVADLYKDSFEFEIEVGSISDSISNQMDIDQPPKLFDWNDFKIIRLAQYDDILRYTIIIDVNERVFRRDVGIRTWDFSSTLEVQEEIFRILNDAMCDLVAGIVLDALSVIKDESVRESMLYRATSSWWRENGKYFKTRVEQLTVMP